jgi:hypothetical protein
MFFVNPSCTFRLVAILVANPSTEILVASTAFFASI